MFKYEEKYGQLFFDQLELEASAKAEAEEHLRATLEKAKQEGEAGESGLAGKFVGYAYDTCRKNIQTLLADVVKPKKTTQGAYLVPMRELISLYDNHMEALEDMLVMLGFSTTMNILLGAKEDKFATLSAIAGEIGKSVKHEANIEKFCQEQAEQGVDSRWIKASMDTGISHRVRKSYKIAYAVNRMNKCGFIGLKWTETDSEVIGAKILEMLIAGSGYFEIADSSATGKNLKVLKLTPWFLEAWSKNEDNLVARAIQYLPTIIPPRHWDNPFSGGYYGESILGTSFIRIKYKETNKYAHDYYKKLDRVDLSRVYDSVNAMQDTPFSINPKILKTLQAIYASGGGLGGVPRTEPYATLPRLPEGATEEEVKEHKKKAVGIYKQEEARKSKALRCLLALKTAEKFKDYQSIYFPWNIDYRGRCYPIPTALSPQGDDIQKSLLLFAKGTPLATDGDTRWLKIHGANLSGNDKISFAERIKWVEDHEEDIVSSANDPLGYTWWYEVSKGDYPMEFLAFCFEYADLLTYIKEYGNAVGFVSTLPLAFDGTCSGLQHFSALLRDEVGGQAVNLMPSDTVQDIYSIVADKVNKVLLEDVLKGTEDTFKTNKDGSPKLDVEGNLQVQYGTRILAQSWVNFNRIKFGKDGITRKVCKRSVMTLAYGSKQYGFKENLLADIIKPYILEHPEDNPFINASQCAQYMAKLIWESVKTTVVKACEGMEWLQKVAGLICESNEVVTWLTPNGLPVQQNYVKMKQEVTKLRFNKMRVRFYNQEPTDEIDGMSQKNGIAPNFIHSMDACHLQRVVATMKNLGDNNFMMIHDSFGTDCAHAGLLYKVIRQEFIGLYKDQNHLANFLESVKYLMADDKLAKVPVIPAFGSLDLDVVLDSDFCFA